LSVATTRADICSEIEQSFAEYGNHLPTYGDGKDGENRFGKSLVYIDIPIDYVFLLSLGVTTILY
jgi:hypothetical protein